MDNKTVSPPSTLFSNTTTSYKFFWGLAIVDIYNESGQDSFHFNIIVSRMLYYAWLINDWQKLNFGGADQLYTKAAYLDRTLQTSNKETLLDKLLSNLDNKYVNRSLTYFYENVPYRFLTPWVGTKITRNDLSNEEVMFGIEAPYYIKGRVITINPIWKDYFDSFYIQYRDRIIQELTSFLSSRNPGKSITKEDIENCLSNRESLHNDNSENEVGATTATRDSAINLVEEDPLKAEALSDSERVDTINQSAQKTGQPEVVATESDTRIEVDNGKVVYISNSELAAKVQSLLRKDRIEAISILANYYRNTPGLTMSLSDWNALLNTISVDKDTDDNKVIAPSAQSSEHIADNEMLTVPDSDYLKIENNQKKSSTVRCASNRTLTKYISGFEEILSVCNDSLPFPSVYINNISIHEGETVVGFIFRSNVNSFHYKFEISFHDVSYFYVAIKPKDNETMDISIKPRVNVMSVKLSNKVIVTCKSASVKSITQC